MEYERGGAFPAWPGSSAEGIRMRACFVTGTDTEIGKTLISSALLHLLSQSGTCTLGIKPIASGAVEVEGRLQNEDVDALARHSSLKLAPETLTPYLFSPLRHPIFWLNKQESN